MADKMTFPATFKEFAEQYKIVDKEEVYTNGVELIPIFRVEQWLDNANVVMEIFADVMQAIEKGVAEGNKTITDKTSVFTDAYIATGEGYAGYIGKSICEVFKKYLGEDINAPTKESEGTK